MSASGSNSLGGDDFDDSESDDEVEGEIFDMSSEQSKSLEHMIDRRIAISTIKDAVATPMFQPSKPLKNPSTLMQKLAASSKALMKHHSPVIHEESDESDDESESDDDDDDGDIVFDEDLDHKHEASSSESDPSESDSESSSGSNSDDEASIDMTDGGRTPQANIISPACQPTAMKSKTESMLALVPFSCILLII